MALVSLNLGHHTSAQPLHLTNIVQLPETTTDSATSNASAQEIFRRSYENRYTWGSQFPGYTAVVEVIQGKKNHRGRIQVNPDLSVEVSGIDNEEARKKVEYRLRMLNIHRQSIPFETAHQNSTFTFGTKDKNGSVEIIEKGKTNASYKILNQRVIQVNRSIGPHAFTVDTLDFQVTPEGYIATRYRATAFQPQTKQILGEEVSEDSYTKIGNYYLPNRQAVQTTEAGEQYKVELNFTNFQLLAGRS